MEVDAEVLQMSSAYDDPWHLCKESTKDRAILIQQDSPIESTGMEISLSVVG